MKILTNAAIEAYREFTKRHVRYARYLAGGVWHRADLLEITTTSTGTVEIGFQIDADVAEKTTVTEVQLYDTENKLWASKQESLSMSSISDGFYYVFQIFIE